MAGKSGKRPTGRKPAGVRRRSAKTDGAFGKEGLAQMTTDETTRNVDKGSARNRRTRTAGGMPPF